MIDGVKGNGCDVRFLFFRYGGAISTAGMRPNQQQTYCDAYKCTKSNYRLKQNFVLLQSQTGMEPMYLQKLILIALLLISGMVNAQNKLALVIGIGDYPEESGWCKIHGDNDISIVTEMLEENGFEQVQILSNKAATKKGIMDALDNLAEKATRGDVIYIHFSGHG